MDGFLESFKDKLNILGVLNLQCTDEMCWQRVKKRSESSNRIDDNQESVKKKINTYNEETLKVLEKISSLTKVHDLDATPEAEEVFKTVRAIIETI